MLRWVKIILLVFFHPPFHSRQTEQDKIHGESDAKLTVKPIANTDAKGSLATKSPGRYFKVVKWYIVTLALWSWAMNEEKIQATVF